MKIVIQMIQMMQLRKRKSKSKSKRKIEIIIKIMDKYDCHGEFYTKKMQVIISARDPISPDSYLFKF